MIRKYDIDQWMYIATDSRTYERFIWTPTVPTAWEKYGYNEPFSVTVSLGEDDHAITLELEAQNHKPNQHEGEPLIRGVFNEKPEGSQVYKKIVSRGTTQEGFQSTTTSVSQQYCTAYNALLASFGEEGCPVLKEEDIIVCRHPQGSQQLGEDGRHFELYFKNTGFKFPEDFWRELASKGLGVKLTQGSEICAVISARRTNGGIPEQDRERRNTKAPTQMGQHETFSTKPGAARPVVRQGQIKLRRNTRRRKGGKPKSTKQPQPTTKAAEDERAEDKPATQGPQNEQTLQEQAEQKQVGQAQPVGQDEQHQEAQDVVEQLAVGQGVAQTMTLIMAQVEAQVEAQEAQAQEAQEAQAQEAQEAQATEQTQEHSAPESHTASPEAEPPDGPAQHAQQAQQGQVVHAQAQETQVIEQAQQVQQQHVTPAQQNGDKNAQHHGQKGKAAERTQPPEETVPGTRPEAKPPEGQSQSRQKRRREPEVNNKQVVRPSIPSQVVRRSTRLKINRTGRAKGDTEGAPTTPTQRRDTAPTKATPDEDQDQDQQGPPRANEDQAHSMEGKEDASRAEQVEEGTEGGGTVPMQCDQTSDDQHYDTSRDAAQMTPEVDHDVPMDVENLHKPQAGAEDGGTLVRP